MYNRQEKLWGVFKAEPFIALGQHVSGLLDPVPDGVSADSVLLAEVRWADVLLQYLPHDPGALLRSVGGRWHAGRQGGQGGRTRRRPVGVLPYQISPRYVNIPRSLDSRHP